MTYGAVTVSIVNAHLEHPEWTAMDIAEFLALNPNTVRSLAGRAQINLPTEAFRRKWARKERVSGYVRPYKKPPYAGKV